MDSRLRRKTGEKSHKTSLRKKILDKALAVDLSTPAWQPVIRRLITYCPPADDGLSVDGERLFCLILLAYLYIYGD